MTAPPFVYEIRDDVFDRDLLQAVADDVPDRDMMPGWQRFTGNAEQGKWALESSLPASAAELVQAMREVGPAWGAELFGIDNLVLSTYGGGYHWIEPGGVLNHHIDFNQHSGMWRHANLLIYLNHDWRDEGGWLEFLNSDGDVFERIPPEFGTTVLMESSERSWHGHPHPSQRWRLSFAGYLWSTDPPAVVPGQHSTIFREAS